MKIGLVVAVEINAVHARMGEPKERITRNNQEILVYEKDDQTVYVAHSGPGEIYAAQTTQFLISECQVDMIANFGVVGGLTDDISTHRVCVVDQVVHYEFDTSEVDDCEKGRYLNYPSIYMPTDRNLLATVLQKMPEIKSVTCASADRFVAKAEDKKQIHELYNADICEMEAAGILLTCDKNGVPCVMIKMVSDGIGGGADEFWKEKERTAKMCIDILLQINKEG